MAKRASKDITAEDLELLGELGVETDAAPTEGRSAREQRIIAGFEEIERFVNEQGRLPQHGEDRDIFERLYAVRLDRLRASDECRAVLVALDTRGLLDATVPEDQELSDEELLASLGVESTGESDLTKLVHVRPYAEIKAAEEVAHREKCPDFDHFKPLFDRVQNDLESGVRYSYKYRDDAAVNQGDWFILDGQKVLVAEMGELFTPEHGRPDSRLRVIYDNGTQSDLLLRSLQRALNKDKVSRRISEPGDARNLSIFDEEVNPTTAEKPSQEPSQELSSGTIYVLRSLSDHPFIAQHRLLIHKIGVTSGDVSARITGAKQDPTFLLADVELVATFKLANINRHKLEALLHKFFAGVRLDMDLKDRFEIPVKPREWFFVPLNVIGKVIDKINDGTLHQFRYDVESASLKSM